ncbi:acyl-CoA Delta(11) desaturase-like [Galleria mellonella]|uniref:Acyl-CoA Delta(11) desaturase-like n=1 Tax=Galleria mellonella TaxID=7137 RepID=A0A6J1WF32_GALME|nr:acyl-CoA Delta(11) desaturase-like [Galleria mellonella]XP_031766645.2 acyl-CoA Delta(11) desaturase-like [Galleria mellonella]XP_052755309.1 acyl-CoA Delta(11) desaturase-like [Galleria mellonella]
MEPKKALKYGVLNEGQSNLKDLEPREYKIVYHNLLTFGYWHLAGIYGLYLCFTSAKWATIILSIFTYMAAEIGVTAGAHRLWAHKTYKAKLPLQIFLMVLNSIAFQNTALHWARDHRLHHKYTDTDIDPHNAKRGFFYSHVGWLLVKKLPKVKDYGRQIDMIDLNNNPVLRFQKKYAIPFIGLVCFIIPTLIPMYFWGESLNNAWHLCMLRYISNLNATFLVNSAAHMWGYKPYDKGILSTQNLPVSLATFGEGFHNYHHVFPWDYRASELGNNKLNLTTKFIDFFAWIGWAYDLKTVPKDMIMRRAKRTGDGTNLWGWEDNDISEEDKNTTIILYEKKK